MAAAVTRPDLRWLARVLLAFAGVVVLSGVVTPALRAVLDSAVVHQADAAVAAAVHTHLGPRAMSVMRAATWAFGHVPVVVAALAGAAWLARRRQVDRGAHLLACVLLGLMLNAIVKLVVLRPRPELPYTYEVLSTFSFPSGHSAQVTLVCGWLLLQAWPQLHSAVARLAAVFMAVLVVLLVTTSRIALGAHYFSDCVAGVAWTVLWLAWCTWRAPAGFVPGHYRAPP